MARIDGLSEEESRDLFSLVEMALAEDLGGGDVTSIALVPPEARASASIVAKAEGVLAGMPAVRAVFRKVDPEAVVEGFVAEGETVSRGLTLGRINGNARSILAGERTALNFLQRLSGVATLTRRFKDVVNGTGASIFDTRKTLPGLRRLDKYAVRMGGGRNHRLGLYDQALIKENHLAAGKCGPLDGVRRARSSAPSGMVVEVEVETLEQFRETLKAGPDVIMLDDMSDEEIRQAVSIRGEATRPLIEVSGGVTLANVRRIAKLGVDRISVGALTHSAPALDVSIRLSP